MEQHVPLWVAVAASLPISGVLTAVLNWLINRKRAEIDQVEKIFEIRRELHQELENKLKETDAENARLRARVAELEAQVMTNGERADLLRRQQLLEEEVMLWKYALEGRGDE